MSKVSFKVKKVLGKYMFCIIDCIDCFTSFNSECYNKYNSDFSDNLDLVINKLKVSKSNNVELTIDVNKFNYLYFYKNNYKYIDYISFKDSYKRHFNKNANLTSNQFELLRLLSIIYIKYKIEIALNKDINNLNFYVYEISRYLGKFVDYEIIK